MSRWLKSVLSKAGIDCTQFQGHSTRAASTSKAKSSGVPIDVIMGKAGWSTKSTFARFYDKQVINSDSCDKILMT